MSARSLIQSKTGAQMILVTLGKGFGFCVVMLTNIIIIRQLNPAEYGIFAIGGAAILVLNGVVGEALDFSVLKVVPLYLKRNREKAYRTVNSTVKIKLILGLFLLVLAVVSGRSIARILFHSRASGQIVVLSALGILGMLMMKTVSTFLQAGESFLSFLMVELSNTILKFAGIVILLYMGSLTAFSALATFAVAPFVAWIVFLGKIPASCYRIGGKGHQALSEMLKYTKWVMLAFAISAIHERLDVFMLGMLRGPGDAGIYSAAYTLGMTPDILISFVGIVLYPKIMPLYRKGTLKGYLLKTLKYTVPVCFTATLISLFLAGAVIRIFYGAQYLPSIPLLQILAQGYIFRWLVLPLAAPFLVMSCPRFMFLIEIVALIYILVGNWILIPNYGPLGSAWISFTSKVFLGTSIILFALKTMDEKPVCLP